MLTKQHFPLYAVGALGVWLIWVLPAEHVKHNELRRRGALLLVAAIAAIFIAGPWYIVHWPDVWGYFAHYASVGFAPHMLGPHVSWQTIQAYLSILLSQMGWPSALLITLGIVWAAASLSIAVISRSGLSQHNVSLIMLLMSGVCGLAAALALRNSNTRFVVPILIIWGTLAGPALVWLWRRTSVFGHASITVLVAFQLLFWWSYSFWPVLTDANTFFLPAQDSFFRPVNTDPLSDAMAELNVHAGRSSSSNPVRVWTVGETPSFNVAMVRALATEAGYSWEVSRIYQPEDATLQPIFERLQTGDLILLREPMAEEAFPGYTGLPRWTKIHSVVSHWLSSESSKFGDVTLLSHLESSSGGNRIFIYRVTRQLSSDMRFP
ncbi:MAG: hypothetical protein KDI03_17140 [Anaerolineae bacterium]|nr:hypothetical protein [Anaerolineae bacterium]